MQTWATWLQLIGNTTIGLGVVIAFLAVSGRLRRLRDAVRGLGVQLRSAISRRNVKCVDGNLTGGSHLDIDVKTDVEGAVFGTGTPEQRLARIENDYSTLKPQFDALPDRWQNDIDDAIAAALDEFSDLSHAARWWDIVPTAIGTLISLAGYICQLRA